MPFTLHPLTEADMRTCAHIRLDAFAGSPAQRALRPQGTTPATLDWYAAKHLRELTNEPHTIFVGVRDEDTGELVAYGQWQRDLASDRAKAAEHSDARDEGEKFSPGSSAGAQSVFWGRLERSEREFMGEADYWHLRLLATKPAYQGKGLATMVMEWGKERAREDRLPAYLDSTEEGRRVYDKVGFVAGPEWNMDLKPYGVDHFNRQWPMRWEASSPRGPG